MTNPTPRPVASAPPSVTHPDARTDGTEALLAAHATVNSTARWPGSPDPSDWHNIRRVCKCGEVIGWHDRSKERPGISYPLSGDAFDLPHRAHIASVIDARRRESEGETL